MTDSHEKTQERRKGEHGRRSVGLRTGRRLGHFNRVSRHCDVKQVDSKVDGDDAPRQAPIQLSVLVIRGTNNISTLVIYSGD